MMNVGVFHNGFFFINMEISIVGLLFQTEESAKAGTCARDRGALQQLALLNTLT